MRVLVTGGAGFIGSHVVDGLLADAALHAQVRVADNLSNGRIGNLAHVRDKIEFLQGDLLDDGFRARAVEGVDSILHLAALGSVKRSLDNPRNSHLNGAHLTLLMLEGARAASVKRFVYASSSSVYGGSEPLPQDEARMPNPLSPYAATKLAGELYVRTFARGYGLQAVSLRYFNVFGPRQRADSAYSAVLAKFCKAFRDGTPVTIFGDGEQSRDFTYVGNAAHANMLALKAPHLNGEAVNVASGERHSLNEIVRVLNTMTGRVIAPVYRPERAGDVRHSLAELSGAANLLGYRPAVDFRSGLAQTLAWYQTNSEPDA